MDDKKYKKIEIEVDGNTIVSAKIIYSDDTYEYINFGEYATTGYANSVEILKVRYYSFALQEGLFGENAGKLLDDKSKIVVKRVNRKIGSVDGDNALSVVLQDDGKKKTGKLKKAFVKITSFVAAGVLAVCGYNLIKKSHPSSSESKDNGTRITSTDVPFITPTTAPTAFIPVTPVTPAPKVVTTKTPTSVPTATARPTNTPTKAPTSAPRQDVSEEERFASIVRRIYNDESVSEEDLLYVMDETHRLSYKNMPGLRDLLNGKRMSGTRDEVKFYEMFPEGSIDRVVLRGYCTLRNNVIDNAFLQDSKSSKDDTKYFLDNIGDFIFNGYEVEYRDTKVDFYDLKPITRFMIVDLAKQTLLSDPAYVGKLGGRNYSYTQLMDEYEEVIQTIADRLANSSGIKK